MKIKYGLLTLILAAIGSLAILGTKPANDLPGVCIYEVSMSAISNTINIGWTLSPCRTLDIRELDDYHQLTHSSFQPVCPVYSVQTWPGIYLPVVDYQAGCDVQNIPPTRKANGGVFHAIAPRN